MKRSVKANLLLAVACAIAGLIIPGSMGTILRAYGGIMIGLIVGSHLLSKRIG